MWRSPGAIRARPRSTVSPSAASLTSICAQPVEPAREGRRELLRHVLDDDDARAVGRQRLEDDAQRLPCRRSRRRCRRPSRWSGPLPGRRAAAAAPRRRSASSAGARGAAGGAARPACAETRLRRGLDDIADAHVRDSSRNCAMSTRGFRMTSTAPASSACIRVSDPSSVSDEHMTTGTGCCAMILRRKVMPSMRGISTSRVMTSGTSSWMRCAPRRRGRRRSP